MVAKEERRHVLQDGAPHEEGRHVREDVHPGPAGAGRLQHVRNKTINSSGHVGEVLHREEIDAVPFSEAFVKVWVWLRRHFRKEVSARNDTKDTATRGMALVAAMKNPAQEVTVRLMSGKKSRATWNVTNIARMHEE